MKDLIRAILGRSTCDWCEDHPPSIVDRLCRLDQHLSREDRHWWEMAVMKIDMFWTERLPIWKLGQAWHWRFHAKGQT